MLNKAIYYILSNATDVTDLVSTRIHAVTAPENTLSPLIVYSSNVDDVVYSKSGQEYDQSSLDLLIVSKDYSETVAVLTAVRAALELVKGTFNGVCVDEAKVTGVREGFDIEADTFYQSLTMRFINK